MQPHSKPRIAIPLPTSTDPEYNARAWAQYAAAVRCAGGDPVEIACTLDSKEIVRLANPCQGILLPGSPADLNPHKYGAEVQPETAAADPSRENVDELLLQDAHNLHKPLLCICYGMQSLNVWRTGTLVQDLLPLPVNHKAGRSVAVAHSVAIAPESRLAEILAQSGEMQTQPEGLRLPVNSSHHQAIGIVGDGLRVVARCPQDGVVEAVEGIPAPGDEAGHFILGLQWHPERTQETSAASRALFNSFLKVARVWQPRAVRESLG